MKHTQTITRTPVASAQTNFQAKYHYLAAVNEAIVRVIEFAKTHQGANLV